MELPGRQQRGSSKKRFMDLVREDILIVVVTEKHVEDRERWRTMIQYGDSRKIYVKLKKRGLPK